MAYTYDLHPENPQTKRIERIVDALRGGAVMLYPTDTVYAIGCDLGNKAAIERVQRLKRGGNPHLTLLCPSLSNVATYARVDDAAYRLMRHLIPGPFTFILPATRQLPRLVLDPKRRTAGLRVPDSAIVRGLLDILGNPLVSTSARLADSREPLHEYELFDELEPLVDLIVRVDPTFAGDGNPANQVSTVLDFTGDSPEVVRRGLGWERLATFLPRSDRQAVES